MSEKRLMLLGANGQIGQALRAEPLPAGWQLGAYGHAELDLTQHGAVQGALRRFKPDIIVNAAAMTAVDEAEKNPQAALAINFDAVANLAAQCSALDMPVIHLSTDYVFDGKDGAVPYKTDARINPLNIYGDSKQMGEEALRHELAWHVILRVSSVFSAFGRNLLTALLGLIDERDELKAPADQVAVPTYAPDIAKTILAIAAALLEGKHDGYGTFHYCGAPPVTRLEFVQAIMESYAPYTARRPVITPVSLKDSIAPARRPAYSVLDCAKIRDVYGIEQKSWRGGLAEAVGVLMRERKKIA